MTDNQPSLPTQFGRYEVLESLGRGAMGVVYKARDPKIDRLVAIKTISFHGISKEKSEAYRERFVVEAKAAGRLTHPGIVAVYDVGEEQDTHTPYIVMEYVQGETLERLLALSPGGLATDQALGIVKQVAEALDYAHREGVVHRDIKPANIIVTADGRAKIADFGVAKLESETSSGMMFGTPAYMSPEQVNGEALDGRSDLFSLGVVLYTALVGFRPFHGSGVTTISFKVVHSEPVPASSFNPTLIEEIDHVIERAMAKDIGARYQNGADMALDLGDLLAGKRPRSSGPAEVRSQNFTFMEAIAPACETGMMRLRMPESGPGDANGRESALRSKKGRQRLLMGCAVAEGLLAVFLGYQALGRTSEAHAISQVSRVAPATETAKVVEVANAKPAVKRVSAVRVEGQRAAAADVSPTISSAKCTLNLEVEHPFQQGQLMLWVDDELLTQEPLFSESRKKLKLFGGRGGQLSSELTVRAGAGVIRVKVVSPEGLFDRTAESKTEFKAGTTKVVRVFAEKGTAHRVELKVYDPLPTTAKTSFY